ncbi:hypothetical protein [Spirosoma montaniterrae]|uniref:Uncharacterized protein n=1 Tax=Spirosoma montaniterrae TaxID=1178516 RepID=A0A1P9WVX0_9BACT|nr:hypothetical protein [Spirosoma montaniterrae]AQG79534.1 hypothetical protein AWR27_09495 [Spirosoma montaniterrae]
MKTSHILFVITVAITLMGMVATNVLLKEQYRKIDWSDAYQSFEKKPLPPARHLIVRSAPTAEIVIEKSSATQALLLPSMAQSYKTRQQGDTLFIDFTMNYDSSPRDPHNDINDELPAGLVLRLPELQSLRAIDTRVTLRNFAPDRLNVSLQNTRLRTHNLTVGGPVSLTASQNSFVVLGDDRYKALQLTIQDSSGAQLNNTQTDAFTPIVSPKSEVQLRGKALHWLTLKK